MIKRTVVALTLATCFVALPREGNAQFFDSSMDAKCVGTVSGQECAVLSFFLTLDGTSLVSLVLQGNSESTIWQFGNLGDIRIFSGPDLTENTADWLVVGGPDPSFVFQATNVTPGFPGALEPIRMVVPMSSYGTFEELFNGELTYSGQASQNGVAGTFAGQVNVTPEPTTVVLFATGLLGIVGIHRRRQKRWEEES